MIYPKRNLLQSVILLFLCIAIYPMNNQNHNSVIFNAKLALVNIKSYLRGIRHWVVDKFKKRPPMSKKDKAELLELNKMCIFMKFLLSDQLKELIHLMGHPNLSEAEWAFLTTKKFWPWHREYTFLIPTLDINTKESYFISELGIDVMKIFERDLITRTDYINKYTDKQSHEIILKYAKQCVELQMNCDRDGLSNEINRLHEHVIKNGKKTVLVDNICLAIAEIVYFNPITELLHTIKYAPTLKEAKAALDTLNQYIQEKEKRKNFNAVDKLLSQVEV